MPRIKIQSSLKNILNAIKKFNMEDMCPNTGVILRILLTITVSIAGNGVFHNSVSLRLTYFPPHTTRQVIRRTLQVTRYLFRLTLKRLKRRRVNLGTFQEKMRLMRGEMRYLTLPMCQERFSCLTNLLTENSVAQNHEFSEEVKISDDVKARKVNFQGSFDVLLTVHLSLFISVFNQLDAQSFVSQ